VVRIALGQINTTVGDLDGNVERMSEWAARATDGGADLVCFPELAITGYPPEDLVLRPQFVRDNLSALEELAHRTADGRYVMANATMAQRRTVPTASVASTGWSGIST